MKAISSAQVFDSYSDNRKSKIQNRKWAGLFVIVVALMVCGARAEAQQHSKVPKIGWLEVRPDDSRASFELFKRELRALGYVDGKSIAFEYRNAGNTLDRLPALADELVRLRVNVVFAVPAPAAVAAKNATKTIPIVFVGGFDLSRPGWSTAWRALAGISPDLPASYRCWLASDSSYSRKPFPSSPVLRRCGIHRMPALHNNGKKANCRQGQWVCSFIR